LSSRRCSPCGRSSADRAHSAVSRAATLTAVAAEKQKNYPLNRLERRPDNFDRRRACDVFIDARFFFGQRFRKTGRPYSSNRDRFLSLLSGDRFLLYRIEACRCGLERLQSKNAIASRHVWNDRIVSVLHDTATHAARFGNDDPIPISDLYQYHRHLFAERTRPVYAMGFLRAGIWRCIND